MALCLAHATAGYLAYEALRPAGPHRLDLLAGAVLLANAPDLDFLPGPGGRSPRRLPPWRDPHAGCRRASSRSRRGRSRAGGERATGLVGVLRRRRVRQPPAGRLDDGRCGPAVRHPDAVAAQRRLAARAVQPARRDHHRPLGSRRRSSAACSRRRRSWPGRARSGSRWRRRERAPRSRAARGALAGPVADESLRRHDLVARLRSCSW